jgi:hypothetical protein
MKRDEGRVRERRRKDERLRESKREEGIGKER